MNTYPKTMISPIPLVRLYKIFRKEPLRVFIRNDLCKVSCISFSALKRYLVILVKMDLIEVVPAVYYQDHPNGKVKLRLVHEVKGYRLKVR